MGFPEIPSTKFHYVARKIHPRVCNGVDWGAERIILVQWEDKELWWRKTFECTLEDVGKVRNPPRLIAAVRRDEIDYDIYTLQEGGRLGRVHLEPQQPEIDRFFEAQVTRLLVSNKTLIISPFEEGHEHGNPLVE